MEGHQNNTNEQTANGSQSNVWRWTGKCKQSRLSRSIAWRRILPRRSPTSSSLCEIRLNAVHQNAGPRLIIIIKMTFVKDADHETPQVTDVVNRRPPQSLLKSTILWLSVWNSSSSYIKRCHTGGILIIEKVSFVKIDFPSLFFRTFDCQWMGGLTTTHSSK